jgi:replicative DNA helicase
LEALQELDLFGVLMSQLNREAMHDRKGRGDKRPQVHHLNGAGALEAFAYQILLMHRECMFNARANGNLAECIVGKAKRGRTGVVEMLWVPHLPAVRHLTDEMRARFVEMDRQRAEREAEKKRTVTGAKPRQTAMKGLA